MKKSGFTLIELLVVVSIIGILSTLGLVSYQTVTKNARDAKRQSDLKTIQSALEQYHADQFYYPTLWPTVASCTDNILIQYGTFKLGCPLKNPNPPGGKTYLNTVPDDPSPGKHYKYVGLPNGCSNVNNGSPCNSYCLYTNLENSSITKPAACTDSNYNFAVTPP